MEQEGDMRVEIDADGWQQVHVSKVSGRVSKRAIAYVESDIEEEDAFPYAKARSQKQRKSKKGADSDEEFVAPKEEASEEDMHVSDGHKDGPAGSEEQAKKKKNNKKSANGAARSSKAKGSGREKASGRTSGAAKASQPKPCASGAARRSSGQALSASALPAPAAAVPAFEATIIPPEPAPQHVEPTVGNPQPAVTHPDAAMSNIWLTGEITEKPQPQCELLLDGHDAADNMPAVTAPKDVSAAELTTEAAAVPVHQPDQENKQPVTTATVVQQAASQLSGIKARPPSGKKKSAAAADGKPVPGGESGIREVSQADPASGKQALGASDTNSQGGCAVGTVQEVATAAAPAPAPAKRPVWKKLPGSAPTPAAATRLGKPVMVDKATSGAGPGSGAGDSSPKPAGGMFAYQGGYHIPGMRRPNPAAAFKPPLRK